MTTSCSATGAGDDGGGCYFDDYWYDGAVVHFNRNLVNDNTALGDYGGCYFYDIEYAEVDFIDNQFNRNTAGGDYGGLYFESVEYGAVMRFWANQIIGNRAGISETVLINNPGRRRAGSGARRRLWRALLEAYRLRERGGLSPQSGAIQHRLPGRRAAGATPGCTLTYPTLGC